MLKADDHIENVLQANSYSEALPLLHLKPHYVFLDIHNPVNNGVETLRLIKKNYPQMTTCVISNQVSTTVRELCK